MKNFILGTDRELVTKDVWLGSLVCIKADSLSSAMQIYPLQLIPAGSLRVYGVSPTPVEAMKWAANNLSKTPPYHAKRTITQVRSSINRKGYFAGFAVGNKVHPAQYFSGWHLANICCITSLDELEKLNNSMVYYMPPELGNRVAWFEMV